MTSANPAKTTKPSIKPETKSGFKSSDILIVIVAIVLCVVMIVSSIIARSESSQLKPLPAPELSEGQRGELGIDKNINEGNIDQYLGRSDSVYYDMRMLEDPAAYESIGGDRYLSGFVDGFEIVPYPYLASVKGLPAAVGEGYTGETLFTKNDDGTYTANYQESETILSDIFPKDKYIFLMCGGGGYAGMTKDLLIKNGWDKDKIYVVGGYWFYDGAHNVKVKNDDGTYSFWKVPYHDINFNNLTKK